MGLSGPSGVLPGFYSELLRRAQRDKNPAMRDFFDIFNHRALSLFVRAAEKYRLPLAVEQAGQEQLDSFSRTLFSLVGFGEASLRGRQAVQDTTLAFYSGHYSRLNRSAAALRQILSDYFGLPVEVEQFQGRWGRLQASEQSRMTIHPTGGSFSQLGVDTVCGSMVFNKQAGFRVIVGPLDYAQFSSFLPHSPQMAELLALTRTYAGPTLDFDVQLILKGEQVPPLRLATEAPSGAQLGWNCWLPTSAPRDDADDAAFDSEAA
jgi:type VI secretion system protein ImpH